MNEPAKSAWSLKRVLSRGLRARSFRHHWFSEWRSSFASADDAKNAFAIFPHWVTGFQRGGAQYGAASPLVSDQDARIVAFDELAPVRGQRVVELGPLEGGHSKQLLDLGASEVVAIESNPEAFLKCLVMKEALGIERLKFLFGDANAVLARYLEQGTTFDVCSAVGVLYHMLDPLKMIELITRIAQVTYVWTHVASDVKPEGEWTKLTDRLGRSYDGRVNHYPRKAHLGGIESRAIWLTEESLIAAFRNFGHEVQMIEKGAHPNGAQVLFVSRRIVP
jgi:hypothetical protein